MLDDNRFIPKIVIMSFPEALNDTCVLDNLTKKYGKDFVLPARSEDKWLDPAKEGDIVFYNSPYDAVHPNFCVHYSIRKKFLPVMVAYGYPRSNYDNKVYAMDSYADSWKVLIENDFNLRQYRKYSACSGNNALLTGYVKMDKYAEVKGEVKGGYTNVLGLSNFLRYSDKIVNVPKQYPEIDFIIRPHPALFSTLLARGIWTNEKIKVWKKQMKSNTNGRGAENNDELQDFAAADAIVHDCGSYLVDWFYTGKPQCYMLKSHKDIKKKFTKFGQECLSHCFIAYSFEEVYEFIEKVVVSGNDTGAKSRIDFAEQKIMLNYPKASEKAIDSLVKEIMDGSTQ